MQGVRGWWVVKPTENHRFGFRWGPMNVNRLTHIVSGKREARVLGVETDHHKVEVSVSRTGRSVRVWLDGVELERPGGTE